ncbi:uncharacterized protein TNCV_3150861 [Trichonephila clavipes]|nr:uncharacterized protein TNCV_3150861 [Trichonephila clavipes]
MRNKEDLYLRNLLMEEMVEELQEQRNQLRQDAKRNIQKIQAENKRTYDRKRKKAPRYQKGDLVAIQRTQFGSGLKLRPKFLEPCKIIEVKPRDGYNLERVAPHHPKILELDYLPCPVLANENPADLISRGSNASDISSKQLWWHGPDFLKEEL